MIRSYIKDLGILVIYSAMGIKLLVEELAKETGAPVWVAWCFWVISVPFSIVYYLWLYITGRFLKNKIGDYSRKELNDFTECIDDLYDKN